MPMKPWARLPNLLHDKKINPIIKINYIISIIFAQQLLILTLNINSRYLNLYAIKSSIEIKTLLNYMYYFKVIKSQSSSAEEFENALYCARSSIESMLDNELIAVEKIDDSIVISSIDGKELISITFLECKDKIKGCFCNSAGTLYPEFNNIIPSY